MKYAIVPDSKTAETIFISDGSPFEFLESQQVKIVDTIPENLLYKTEKLSDASNRMLCSQLNLDIIEENKCLFAPLTKNLIELYYVCRKYTLSIKNIMYLDEHNHFLFLKLTAACLKKYFKCSKEITDYIISHISESDRLYIEVFYG